MKRDKKEQVNRRDFLNVSWGVMLFGLFGQAGMALFNFLKPKIEAGSFGSKVVAGQVEEFQSGTVSHVQKGRFYISRLEDGASSPSGIAAPTWAARYPGSRRVAASTVPVIVRFLHPPEKSSAARHRAPWICSPSKLWMGLS